MSERDYLSYNVLDDEHIDEVRLQDEATPQDEVTSQDKTKGQDINYKIDLVKAQSSCEVATIYGETQEKENGLEESQDISEEGVNQVFEESITHMGNRENEVIDVKFLNTPNQSEQHKQVEKTYEPYERDTSFKTYVDKGRKKQRGNLEKWLIRGIKLMVFIMLLPVIIFAIGAALGIVGAVLGTVVAFVGGGIGVIVLTLFTASKLTLSMILLGILVSIAMISFGGIIVVLILMGIKFVMQVIRNIRNSKKQTMKEGI